jgi:hypothetical protein
LAGVLGLVALLTTGGVGAVAKTTRAQDIRTRTFGFTTVHVPNSNFSEPSIALTKRDAVLFCGPTRPTVAYIRTADWKTFVRQSLGLAGGSDCDVKVGPDNHVFVADLQAFGTEIMKSYDDGASYMPPDRTEEPIEEDRQWLGVDPNNPHIAYLAFHDLALEAEVVAKSTDGGRTFPYHAIASSDPALFADTYPNTFSGPVRVDPTDPGRVYVVYGISSQADNVDMCKNTPTNCPFGAPRSVVVASSGDGGQTWTDKVAMTSPPGSVLGNLFPWITVDGAGTVYATAAGSLKNEDGTFSNGLWLTMSRDKGATWSPMRKVNQGNGASVFPTMIAGDAGVVDLAWLESDKEVQNASDAVWRLHFAQARGAGGSTPTFTELAGPVVRHGAVCTLGINCSGNRDLGDFMEIDLDSFGYAHVATASTEKFTATDPARHVVWWRQDRGPSATLSVCEAGCVATRPKPPGAS